MDEQRYWKNSTDTHPWNTFSSMQDLKTKSDIQDRKDAEESEST